MWSGLLWKMFSAVLPTMRNIFNWYFLHMKWFSADTIYMWNGEYQLYTFFTVRYQLKSMFTCRKFSPSICNQIWNILYLITVSWLPVIIGVIVSTTITALAALLYCVCRGWCIRHKQVWVLFIAYIRYSLNYFLGTVDNKTTGILQSFTYWKERFPCTVLCTMNVYHQVISKIAANCTI